MEHTMNTTITEKKKLQYTQNRELSWLRFNQRVLEEAKDHHVPLLERLKFVAIFTSNLDEFFMIRVGSLYDMKQADNTKIDTKSGMTPEQQLDAVYKAIIPLYKERDKVYSEIRKGLAEYGIKGLEIKDLDTEEKKYLKKYFKENISPVLSPQIVDMNHPFPYLVNNEIYVTASLKKGSKKMLGIIPVPAFLTPLIYVPGENIRILNIEKVIYEFVEMIFDQYQVSEKNYICVTRNADISPNDEAYADCADFRYVMKKTLNKRRKMAAVRFEVYQTLTKESEVYWCEKLGIDPICIYRTKTPMRMDYVYDLMQKIPDNKKKKLLDQPFEPQVPPALVNGSMTEHVRKKDVILAYPYDSMDPFLRLIKEAANDPEVLTIKITIYRLAKKTRLVEYLCAAAENGKEVTVLIELRARFDEQNNIDWSERMEEAGCKILYGFDEYKVHSKICLITYRSRNKIHYITQIGTGNYNEKTAKLYTDYSLITADQKIGEDAAKFFVDMGIGNLEGTYEHLLVSPTSLKPNILRLMDEQIVKGKEGRIIMKMNSVTDYEFIQKVAEASKAGVKIDLLVRGICCILPQISGETDNLTVTSIVGRFLEHPRVFIFGNGDDSKIYIGSADMMTRNTENRVEILCPVFDTEIKEVLKAQIDTMLQDNVKARVLCADGTYQKKEKSGHRICAQEIFIEEVLERAEKDEHVEQKKESLWQKFIHFFKGRKG